MDRLRIGELLVQAKLITPERLEDALTLQRAQGRKLGQVLIDLGIVNETQLTQALGQQLSVPWVSLYHIDFSRQLLNLVPREIAELYCLVPIYVRRVRKQGETLYVAMDDPTNEVALEAVRLSSSLPVRPMIAAPSDIRSAIRVYYETGEPEPLPSTAPEGGTPLTVRSSAPPDPPRPPPPPPAPRSRPSLPESAASRPSAPSMSVAAEPEIQMIEAAPQPAAGAVEEASEVASFPPPSAPLPLPSPIPASAPFEPVPTSHSGDSPDAWPEVEARTMELPARAQRSGKKMVALTLLDGTTIRLPAKPGRNQEAETAARVGPHPLGEMTARDLIKALHAVAEGADGTAIFGERVPIEAICATILSLLLRKGLMADWEFVEEIRKKK